MHALSAAEPGSSALTALPTLGLLNRVHDYASAALGRNALSARRFRLFASTTRELSGLARASAEKSRGGLAEGLGVRREAAPGGGVAVIKGPGVEQNHYQFKSIPSRPPPRGTQAPLLLITSESARKRNAVIVVPNVRSPKVESAVAPKDSALRPELFAAL